MQAKRILSGTGLAAAFLWTACAATSGFQVQQQAGAKDQSQVQETVKQRPKKIQVDDDEPGTVKQRAKTLLEQLEAQKEQIEDQLRSQLEQLEIQKKQLLDKLDRQKAAAEEVARKQLQQLEQARKKLPELLEAMKQGTLGERRKPVESKPSPSLDDKLDQILDRLERLEKRLDFLEKKTQRKSKESPAKKSGEAK